MGRHRRGAEAALLHLRAASRPPGSASARQHIIDILRGKRTAKVAQFGHERLSTFGIGADLEVAQWRAVLRQLVMLRLVQVDTIGTACCA